MTATESAHPPPICCEWQLIAESQDARLHRYRDALENVMECANEHATIETQELVASLLSIARHALTGKSPLPCPAKLITTSDELRAWRALHRWTQQHAARVLGVGYATYRGYETGSPIPRWIALLCEFVRRHGPMDVGS